MDPTWGEELTKIQPHKELFDIPYDGAKMLDMRDPEVRAAVKQAKKQVHKTQEEIMQQLSVALKDPEFRDHIRELHPDLPDELLPKKEEPPIRKGKAHYTKPKIDAPANRKKNKAARKARKKGH